MLSREAIERGGSKLEMTRALIELGLDISIPHSAWKYYGNSLDSILPEFQSMQKPVIVRGSHMNDYHGFIDVVPTIKDVQTREDLEAAVKEIETEMATETVKRHSEDWGQPFTPEVHILLQEQSPSKVVGTMLRHPHTNKILIQYINLLHCEPRDVYPLEISAGEEMTSRKRKDPAIAQLLDMYIALEQSGLFDPAYSYQVEFGLEPLFFYQARPFKKLEPEKDFDLPCWDDGFDHPHITALDVVGITPEEGIEMPFVSMNSNDADNQAFFNYHTPENEEFGLFLTGKMYESMPTGTALNKMTTICTSTFFWNSTFHPTYRLIKRAQFSFLGMQPHNMDDGSEDGDRGLGHLLYDMYHGRADFSDFKQSRVFSNGRNGVIIPTKYL